MSYEKDLKEILDEYAIKKNDRIWSSTSQGRGQKRRVRGNETERNKKGIKDGIKEVKSEVIRNFLSADKFSIAEIANFIKVPEAFVRKVKKEMKW